MKLNILEKKAIIGSLLVSLFFAGSVFIIGKKNMWFEKKAYYQTNIKDADGLRVGSIVTLSGLKVGEVSQLNVGSDGINVHFSIKKKLSHLIKKDARAYMFRNFIIGEKRVDISPGMEEELLPSGGLIEGVDSLEIADMISGKNMAKVMGKVTGLTESFSKWSDILAALTKKVKVKDLTSTYDLLLPTIYNIKNLTHELLKITRPLAKKKTMVKQTLDNVNLLVVDLNKITSPVAKRQKLIEQILDNINIMSKVMANNPNFSQDVIDSLKELNITLKALQKTWLLESHVESVKKKK